MTHQACRGMPRSALFAWLVAAATALALAACGASRPVLACEELTSSHEAFIERITAERAALVLKMARRMKARQDEYDEASATGAARDPAAYNVLVLSGGGDFGAFGAGVLQGWGTVQEGPLKRPDFDVVTGVSTGALIAPFAFVGGNTSYDRAFQLYRQPKRSWAILKDIFFFLPWRESFLDVSELKDDIRRSFTPEIVASIASESKKNRLLVIGATNLDFAILRGIDLGLEAESAAATGNRERFNRIMQASSAIPGAFPPVTLDDSLYVDGGVVANIFYDANTLNPGSPTSVFRREYPGVAVPKIRVWVVVNNQLGGHPETTQPNWPAVSARSLAASVRANVVASLKRLALEALIAREVDHLDFEFRFVAIPNSWVQVKQGIFEKETMESLAQLGRKMGADPSSWNVEEPGSRTIEKILEQTGMAEMGK